MTLFQHTLGALLRGEKTETSRLALPDGDGEHIIGREMIQFPNGKKAVMRGANMRWFPKWQVGSTYAIQPNRGIKAVGRYEVLDVWKQDVRMLTMDQVDAEGFDSARCFWDVWMKMHDLEYWKRLYKAMLLPGQTNSSSNAQMKMALMNRPAERYAAWRMSISVVWNTIDWDAPAVQVLKIDPYRELSKGLTDEQKREIYLGKWTPPVV